MSTSLDQPGADLSSRCCARHSDWATLAQHLLEEFPDATITEIVRQVRNARDAVEGHGIDDKEAVTVGEAIVRNQLCLLTGRAVDAARLDPERHERVARARSAL